MKITRIRIPSSFTIAGQPTRFETAEFKLGKGPCGKTVTALTCKIDADDVMVLQEHTDGSYKEFYYPRFQITGRVEVEHGFDYLGDDIEGEPCAS